MMVKSIDSAESMIVSSLIRSSDFIRQIRPFLNPDLFVSIASKNLVIWCSRYFDEYKKAPSEDVRTFVHSDQYQRMSEEDQSWVSKVLLIASRETTSYNLDYHLDTAFRYLRKRRLVVTAEEARALAEGGDLDSAEGLLKGWKPVSRRTASDLFGDPQQVVQALSHSNQSFRLFAGMLGREINPYLARESFFAFMAPEKRGKSMWLMEVAVRASRAKLNVAMFQLGDMSESQIVRRFIIRISGKNDDPRYCGERIRPVSDCAYNQDGSCDESPCYEADAEPIWSSDDRPPDIYRIEDRDADRIMQKWRDSEGEWTVCRRKTCPRRKLALWYERVNPQNPLTIQEAQTSAAKWKESNGVIRLSNHSAGTCSVATIAGELNAWEAEDGFSPDVIVIDYPDIMSPEPGSGNKERRHQENERWIALRALSTERRAAVVVATQTAASAYGKRRISLSDYSEDKRKFAHVTAMYAINQTSAEKRLRLFRVSPLLVRDGEGDSSLDIPVLYFPEIYQAYLASQ